MSGNTKPTMHSEPVTRSAPEPAARDAAVPLCVDLDGTLLRSDLLVESALALLATRPWLLLAMPFWLLRGRARLKREIAARVDVDGEFLPWDERLLERLRAERPHRRLVLCTAADREAAARAVAPLALFDEVVGSDGERNLAGRHKGETLVARFGERGFDYVANHRVDLPIWRVARRGRMHDDPVVFAVTDRVSLATVAIFGAVALVAI